MKGLLAKDKTLVITSVSLIVVVIIFFSVRIRKNDQSSLAEDPQSQVKPAGFSADEILKEAGTKRFEVNVPAAIKQTGQDNINDAKEKIAKNIMIETLIGEALDHTPEIIEEAKQIALEKKPVIVRLTQKKEGKETFSQSFVIHNTKSCPDLITNRSFSNKSFKQLSTEFCMDTLLDYPGGFDQSGLFDVEVYDINKLSEFEGVDNQWSSVVRLSLRNLVKKRYVEHYQKTRSLSYDL